ncbi:hypothetical protein EYF80_045479 [Liparis tanakae]|uniref:Uncharacterized protein n=1 Tax=Liparis tanakae TaxID=230148 RepID=A0A4Z2FSY5_9TELE|nr:hypothetical protein EYF80_045479 [Liparis tanakae]
MARLRAVARRGPLGSPISDPEDPVHAPNAVPSSVRLKAASSCSNKHVTITYDLSSIAEPGDNIIEFLENKS